MLHQLLVLKVFGGKENNMVNNKFTCPQTGLWNTSEDGWIHLMKIKKTSWTICLSTRGEFIRLDNFGCLLEFSCVLGKSNESHKWLQRTGNQYREVSGGVWFSPLVQQTILNGSKLNCKVALSFQLLGNMFIWWLLTVGHGEQNPELFF